jgi:hypothetical protein
VVSAPLAGDENCRDNGRMTHAANGGRPGEVIAARGAAVDAEARRVPLSEFVSGLREELRAAQAARDPGLPFAVGPVSVEFAVVTEREGGPEAKVRFWVVDVGGSARWSREATQKVSLTLTPVDEKGQPLYISDHVPEPPE